MNVLFCLVSVHQAFTPNRSLLKFLFLFTCLSFGIFLWHSTIDIFCFWMTIENFMSEILTTEKDNWELIKSKKVLSIDWERAVGERIKINERGAFKLAVNSYLGHCALNNVQNPYGLHYVGFIAIPVSFSVTMKRTTFHKGSA